MDRRSFLFGTGTLLISQLLAGCNSQEREKLRVQLLKGSLPNQVVQKFREKIKQTANLEFASVEHLDNLFDRLQSWQQQSQKPTEDDWRSRLPLPSWLKPQNTNPADLVTLGDYWLAAAIRQNLIQPLDPVQLSQWSQLSNRWQELVRRNKEGQLDAKGDVWAAPYRWGYTVIAYNRDKFKPLGWKPQDWGDLWREELRDRISLPNHPREVIGLTLKHLGKSYNTENLNQVPDLAAQLRRLHQQVKLYSSDTYLQPLILGDTWLAVGWSNDIIPVMQRYRQIAAVVPQSGTALWADLWANPSRTNSDRSLAYQWIDFCWLPRIAQQILLLSKANSPIPLQIDPNDLQAELRPLLEPNDKILDRSEFLHPLTPDAIQQYQALWEGIIAG
jgi:putative spermidine/putrescine transport system substrate-binding protein